VAQVSKLEYAYTAKQAEALLAYVEVKIPGMLAAGVAALKKAELWPYEETDNE
jgi:hypothetical protein